MTRFAIACTLFTALCFGCSSDPGLRTDPVDVTGAVTATDGKPVKDATLTFQPTDSKQIPASFPLKADGKFSVKLIPGKYTYMFEGKTTGIPPKYLQNQADHSVEVPAAGGEINIKLEK